MRTFILSLFTCAALLVAAEPPQARPFSLLRPNGEKALDLASYRGKVVALVFISTSCPHCQDFTRTLIPIANEYTPRGVQFLECAVNGDAAESVDAFVRQFQPPFPVGYNTQPAVDDFLQRSILLTFYVPRVVLLSRSGRMVADHEGESDFMKNPATNLRAELDKLLKPPAGTPKKTASPAKTAATASK
jgi:thiol-disulfide isomerase/thioredoxin